MKRYYLALSITLSILISADTLLAEDHTLPPSEISSATNDPLDLSPKDFFSLDLSVFSPSKKLQKLKNTPSATYVLTAEDIRRSGVTKLVDLFRLVPGLDVAQVSANQTAVTARGFNQVYGNKILMLIDGIPVETPIFNGVLWENFQLPLDIIERIEFVRGPGATTWGTRAMNGLINVITKDAFTLPHSVASVGGGSEHLLSAYARTGKVLSEETAVQTFVKIDKFNHAVSSTGDTLNDEWNIVTAQLRGDFKPSDRDNVKAIGYFTALRADYEMGVPNTDAPYQEQINGKRQNNRGTVGLQWQRDLGNGSDFNLDWSNLYELRNDQLLDLSAYYSEIEARHRFQPIDRNELTYGLNFRFYTDSTTGSDTLAFQPESRSLEYYRGFFNNETEIVKDVLKLTLGSRFEQNQQVGFAALPTARILWNVNEKFSLWGSVSRAQGTPSRVYDDLRVNVVGFEEPESGLPAIAQVVGNRDLFSEKLTAYEIGSWSEPVKKLYVSATAFYFDYSSIINNPTPGDPLLSANAAGDPFIVVPFPYENGLSARSFGLELTADWHITDWYSLVSTYSMMYI
jgi:iron complex outermembrane receptor protein